MTKITKVKIHQLFASGSTNEATSTDMQFMTGLEAETMSSWIEAILRGDLHPGVNKPSYLENGVFRPGTEAYRDNDIWHYHCGPYLKKDDPPQQYTDNTFAINLLGRRSAPIYHYSKQSDTIIVLGYSRLHCPFPLPTSKKNPIPARGYSLDQVIDFS